MNETVIEKTRFDRVVDVNFLKEMYRHNHLLACADLHPNLTASLTDFIQKSIRPDTSLAIDSGIFGHDYIKVDKIIEFERYQALWNHADIEIVSSISQISNDSTYDNVIAVGSFCFKYNTVDEYVHNVNALLSLVRPNGNLIVSWPNLHFQYHRLRYQPRDIIYMIQEKLGHNITDTLDLGQEYFLKIEKHE